MKVTSFACDYCRRLIPEGTDCYVAWTGDGGVLCVQRWDSMARAYASDSHLCSQMCVLGIASGWMASGVLEKVQ